MWLFYICSLLPILIGLGLLIANYRKQIVWQEWAIGSGAALLTAVVFHMISCIGMTRDIQTYSGMITSIAHYGAWVEEYQQMHTRSVPTGTDKNGNTTYTTEVYYTTEHDHHPEKWMVERDFGKRTDEVEISENLYSQILFRFGDKINKTQKQSTSHVGGSYDGGDQNIYITDNNTGYIYPVTKNLTFENKVKAAPSLFSFPKVPTNVVVYPWPENPDWLKSERLLGTASVFFSRRLFDLLNTSIGPSKKVNLIMVGFEEGISEEYGHWQEAAWIGGKKNDLVICFGGGNTNKPADWSYVFGWTERELVKQNLKTLLINNPLNNNLLNEIKTEVINNYQIKDWSKFDYITIEPPPWSYWAYFITMIITQSGLWIWFHTNDIGENKFNISRMFNSRFSRNKYHRYFR